LLRAVELARETAEAGHGGPFGAVVVLNGEIVGQGANRVTQANDPTAHAEVEAIRNACAKLQRFSLQGAQIFTTCEPCPMCLGAIYWARLDKIWFAASRKDAARIGFDDEFLYQELPRAPQDRALPSERLEVKEAFAVMQAWQADPGRIRY
jgi:guanine deaminase